MQGIVLWLNLASKQTFMQNGEKKVFSFPSQ
jgi:hypothetical protein